MSSCRLLNNIKHTCEYNTGGISDILLLDIRDYDSFRFREDNLFDTCYVEAIRVSSSMKYMHLDVIDSSNFTENEQNGIYSQKLTTFIRGLDSVKTSDLLLAKSNKYLVIFTTTEGRSFVFGSDGGCSISSTQQTGQQGESDGYSLTITKQSVYPLFEFDLSAGKLYTYQLHDKFFEKIFD